jgi:hypothetical protein
LSQVDEEVTSMEYFNWHGKRLFRRDPSTGKEERWDAAAGGWVDVEDFVTQEFDMDPDPRFDEVDEAEAKKTYPDAFAEGASSVETQPEPDAQGDSRFNALSVEQMSSVQSYIMGGKTVEDYITAHELDPEDEATDQIRLYGDLIQKDYDGLEPQQTLHAPGEWT